MVIDTRTVQAFGKNHIPGTINIPHGLDFATWTGWLTGYATLFYIIAAGDQVDEMAKDLFYIGLDNMAGYFETSILQTWVANGKPLQSDETTIPQAIAEKVKNREVTTIAVRPLQMWKAGHIPGAMPPMLGLISDRGAEISKNKPILL